MSNGKLYKGLPPHVYKALRLTAKGALVPMLDYVYKKGNALVASDRDTTYVYEDRQVGLMPDGLYELSGSGLELMPADTLVFTPPNLYPVSGKDTKTVSLPAEVFKRVLPLLSKDDLRPAMSGILVELLPGEKELVTVGTDGHALGISRAKVGHVPAKGQCVLPAKVGRLHALLGAGTLTFWSGRGQIVFASSMGRVLFNPVDAQYPDYLPAIPASFPIRHRLNAGALIGALTKLPKPENKDQKWIVGVSGNEWRAVLLDSQKNEESNFSATILLPSSVRQSGSFTHGKPDGVLLMPIMVYAYMDEGQLAFSAQRLLKSLNALGTEGLVHLDVSAPNRATFLTVANQEKINPNPLLLRARALKLKLALLNL